MFNFGNKEFRNLQEQVLKNAQDIETLKGRENLQIVIVEELPEEGNPNYIYLVPNNNEEEANIYDEYIWLADSEEYEKIGGVDIDLTHYVTLDTEQTITGTKKFQTSFYLTDNWCFKESASGIFYLENVGQGTGIRFEKDKLFPYTNNYTHLGNSSFRFKNLYLSGDIDIGSNLIITKDSSDRFNFNVGGTTRIKIGGQTSTYCNASWTPDSNNTYNLGTSGLAWKDLYLTGNISDGVHTVSVANISSKVTSTYASGTFDSNGESTIDISGGTPEGLFIFNCGNCQAMLHLTATMVQNAELTPIVVSCHYIENGTPQSGKLSISKSGNTLTLFLGTAILSHVDSGYAWTLVKTNLL